MDEDEDDIIERLTLLYLHASDRCIRGDEARAFLAMYREMQEIDQETAEQRRVEHAREMSRPRR